MVLTLHTIVSLALLLALVAVLLSIAVLPVMLVLRLVRGSARTPAQDAEETRLIQEIHHGLERMEQRLEAIETIVFDDVRREGRSPLDRRDA